MKARVDGKEYEGRTPRECYDNALKALRHDGMTQGECRKIKAQVLKSLGAEDWHPAPVVVAPPVIEE